MSNISRLIAATAQGDAKILDSEFLAPRAARRQSVSVRIAGIVCAMRVPDFFIGWGVFKPVSHRYARLVREATSAERDQYLALFPKVRLLVAGATDAGFVGVLWDSGDNRFRLDGTAVPIGLCAGVELFDCIIARFDGAQFWFDGPDNGRSPAYAEILRAALAENLPCPEASRLLPSERWLFGFIQKATKEAQEVERRGRGEYRLADALARAGAVMRSYIERQDGFTVEYTVNGERHSSFVDRNLHVQAAGICLSGGDRNFDLNSLVGVIKEGQSRRLIHHVGLREDDADDE